MIPLEKFIHQPCLAYGMVNSGLFCLIWLTGSMTYLFKEVQVKKIMLSNYLWIGPKTIDTVIMRVLYLKLHMSETFE